MKMNNNPIDCPSEEILSAYLDHDLTSAETIEIVTHLEHCATCTTTLDELETLKSNLVSLSAVESPAELWSQVCERRQRDTANSPLAWLRGLWGWPPLVMLGTTAALLAIVQPAEQPVDRSPGPTSAWASAFPGVHEAERTYISSIDALEQALANGDPARNPEVQRVIEQDLAQIDKTIEECKDELQDTPQDIAAHRGLLEAYQCKVDLLAGLVD